MRSKFNELAAGDEIQQKCFQVCVDIIDSKKANFDTKLKAIDRILSFGAAQVRPEKAEQLSPVTIVYFGPGATIPQEMQLALDSNQEKNSSPKRLTNGKHTP